MGARLGPRPRYHVQMSDSAVLQELDPVGAAHVCQAALHCESAPVPVSTPRNLDLSFFTHGGSTVSVPCAVDMRRRLQGFLSANTIGYLPSPRDDIKSVTNAERRELTDGASRTAAPDGTLPARWLSLVFLARGNDGSGGGLDLLNAASHLASTPTCDQELPMTRDCRMTFLCGEDAESYLSIMRDALPEASRRIELIPPVSGTGSSSVCVLWSVKMGHTIALNMRAARLPSVPRGQVFQVYENIVSAVSEICASASILAPASLCGQRAAPTCNSFLDSQIKAHLAFQSLLLPDPVLELSGYARSQTKFSMCFSGAYVRIVNRSFPVHHCTTFTGFLLHETDKQNEVATWLQGLRADEPSRLYGLRPCTGSYEQQLGVHILAAYAHEYSMGTAVSCYGLKGHPGQRLAVKDGCSVFQIRRTIRPLCKWVHEHGDFFVLPCTEASSEPGAVELRKPYALMLRNSIIQAADFIDGTAAAAPCAERRREAANPAAKQPTADERFCTTGIGLGMEVEASTVGEIYDELVKREKRPDALAMLLLAMVARCGRDASVVEAFEWLRKSTLSSAQRITQLETEVQDLVQKQLEAAPSESPPPPLELPETQTSADPLLLHINASSLHKVTTALCLDPGAGVLKMMNTASEDEVDKLLALVSKSLGTVKKKLPSDVAAAARALHASVAREAPLTRALSVAGVVSVGIRPLTSRSLFLLSEGADTMRLYEAAANENTRRGLDALFAVARASLIHFKEASTTLFYFAPRAA